MTAPDLVEVVATALWDASRSMRGRRFADCTDETRAHFQKQARAVLDALAGAGNVEWAIFRKQNGPNGQPFDTFTHATMSESQSRIDRMYLPELRDLVEPRSRLVFPWTAAE